MPNRPLGRLMRSSSVRAMGVGAFAQILTVVSSLLPVFLGFGAELIFVIQATAVVSVVLNTISLGVVLRLPALQDSLASRRLIVAGLIASLIFAAASSFLALLLFLSGSLLWLARLSCGIAILAPCWTAYVSAISELVRRADFAGVSRLRVVYGTALILATAFSCLAFPSDVAFLACSIVSFLLASLYGFGRTRVLADVSLGMTKTRVELFLHECKRGAWLSLSQIVSGLSYQAPGLVVGHVGSSGPMMASTVRLMSGFQTVGGQLVAPQLDIDVVKARKVGDSQAMRKAANRSLLVAVGLGIGAAATTAVTLAWLGSRGALLIESYLGWMGAVLLAFGAASLSPISHLLTIVEGTRTRIIWDVVRATLTVAVILIATSGLLVLALGVVFTIASVSYAILFWRQSTELVRGFVANGE